MYEGWDYLQYFAITNNAVPTNAGHTFHIVECFFSVGFLEVGSLDKGQMQK